MLHSEEKKYYEFASEIYFASSCKYLHKRIPTLTSKEDRRTNAPLPDPRWTTLPTPATLEVPWLLPPRPPLNLEASRLLPPSSPSAPLLMSLQPPVELAALLRRRPQVFNFTRDQIRLEGEVDTRIEFFIISRQTGESGEEAWRRQQLARWCPLKDCVSGEGACPESSQE